MTSKWKSWTKSKYLTTKNRKFKWRNRKKFLIIYFQYRNEVVSLYSKIYGIIAIPGCSFLQIPAIDQTVLVITINIHYLFIAFQWNDHYYVLIKEDTGAFFRIWFRVPCSVWRCAWHKYQEKVILKHRKSKMHFSQRTRHRRWFNDVHRIKREGFSEKHAYELPVTIIHPDSYSSPLRIHYNGKVRLEIS